MLWFLAAVITVVIIIYLRRKFANRLRRVDGSAVPSTTTLDFIKGRIATGRGKHSIMIEQERITREKFGKVYTFQLGPIPMVSIADGELAKKIFHDWSVYKKASFEKFNPILTEYFGRNIVFVNGEDWRRHRKLMDPAFFKLEQFMPVFVQQTEKCLEFMEKAAAANNRSISVPFWMQRFTLDALGECIFGHQFDYLSCKPSKHLEAYETFFSSLTNAIRFFIPFYDKLPLPSNKRFNQSMQTLDDLVYKLIDQSMKKGSENRNSLLDVLTDSCGDNTGLDKRELHDNILVLFLAGHETSASSLSFACHQLAKYPEVQEQLYQEIRTVIGDGEITYDKISECKYINATIKETLRMFPPIAGIPPRVLDEDQQLGDYIIPANALIRINVYAIHHDENIWKEPMKFRPERWINEEKNKSFQHFIPFGGGARTCIGNNFSLVEQKVFLAMLLKKYRIELDSEDIEFMKGGILKPTDNNYIKLIKR